MPRIRIRRPARRRGGPDGGGMREDRRERRFRGGGGRRMPRGVPTRLQGGARRAVKAKKAEGRGLGEGREGEDRGGRTARSGGGRVRGEQPPLLPCECAASAAPEMPSRPRQVQRSASEKTPPPETEMLPSPNFPFLHPIFPLAFSSGYKPQEAGVGVGNGKRKGNFPFPFTHDLSPCDLLPDGCSPGPLPRSRPAAATSPLQPGARPPRAGGAGLRRPLTCRGCGR